jgi:putative oxidoreductase
MMNSTTEPGLLRKSYGGLVCAGSYLQSTALLLVRIGWGWELYLSGFRHLHNVPTMVERFTGWGVPLPHLSVYVSGITELVGGVLLFFGVGARVVAVPLLFNFIVAYLTASRKKITSALGGPDRLEALENLVNDDAFPFMVMSLLMIAFGAGRFSIDHLLKRIVFRQGKPHSLSEQK